MKRQPTLLLILISVVFLITACSSEANPTAEPVEAQLPIPVKIVVLPFLSFAPYHLAEAEGYFTEQGLAVENVEFDDNADAIPALAQGQLDVAAGFISVGTFNTMAQGANIRVVADKGYIDANETCPSYAYLANREILDGASPAGATISFDPVSIDGYWVDTILGQYDLNSDDVQQVDLPPPVAVESLTNGDVDVIQTNEPWTTRALDAGGEIWMPVSEFAPGFQAAVILYGPSILDSNPDLGNRFMTAYLKGVRQYNEGKTDRNIEILAGSLDMEADFLRRLCWPSIHSDGQVNIDSIMDYQSWAGEKGYLDQPVSADQMFDSTFIDAANNALGAP